MINYDAISSLKLSSRRLPVVMPAFCGSHLVHYVTANVLSKLKPTTCFYFYFYFSNETHDTLAGC